MAHVGEADCVTGAMAPYSTSEPGFGELVNAGPLGPICGRSVADEPSRQFQGYSGVGQRAATRRGRDNWSLRLAACQGVSASRVGWLPGSAELSERRSMEMRQLMRPESERARGFGQPEEGLLQTSDWYL